jgi:hypothetical protein
VQVVRHGRLRHLPESGSAGSAQRRDARADAARAEHAHERRLAVSVAPTGPAAAAAADRVELVPVETEVGEGGASAHVRARDGLLYR